MHSFSTRNRISNHPENFIPTRYSDFCPILSSSHTFAKSTQNKHRSLPIVLTLSFATSLPKLGAPVVSGGLLPSPDNDIYDPREEAEQEHVWIRGTSVPTSVSAPHRSDLATTASQSLDDEQNGTGRGIRAHEAITGKHFMLNGFLFLHSCTGQSLENWFQFKSVAYTNDGSS